MMEILEIKCKICGGPIPYCFDVPHVYDWEQEYCSGECFKKSDEYLASNYWIRRNIGLNVHERDYARKHLNTIKYILEDGNPYKGE
jgi:hypothetical protein